MRGVTLLILCLLVLTGCNSGRAWLDQLDHPDARIKDVRFVDLSLEAVTLEFDVDVANPYPAALPVDGLAYDLQMDGRSLLAGDIDVETRVPANGVRGMTVPVRLQFADLLEAVQQLEPGAVVPYLAQLDVSAGPVSVPVQHAGELPIPALPTVELASLSWDEFNWTRTAGTARLQLVNPNSFGIDIERFDYRLDLGGVTVARSRITRPVRFAQGEAATLELPVELRPLDAGTAAMSLIQGGAADYALVGELQIETPFGPLDAPYDSRGRLGR